jgi:hypothetical protein
LRLGSLRQAVRTLEETEKKILKAIEQDSAEYHGDVHAIFASAQEALPQPAAYPGARAPSWKPVSEEVLRDLSVTLWAHDWSCLQDVTFW